jgi:predicted metal-dependent peptidase
VKTVRQKRLDGAQIYVVQKVPFFAAGVAKLPVEWDDTGRVPTACTDGKRIIWGGKFFDELPDAVLPTVLCHEVCHCLLGHIWRAPSGADLGVWNQAIDHATNLMLKEFSASETAKSKVDPFPFPEPCDAYCANPAFKGMAEEQIYQKLASQKPPGGSKQPQGASSVAKPGQSGGKGGKAAPGSNGAHSMPSLGGQSGGKGGKAAPGSNGAHSMPSLGDVEPANNAGSAQAEAKKLRAGWEGTLRQSARMAAGRGNLPGNLERLITEMVSPKVRWQDVLRNWLREQINDDWDFLQPAMEYSDSGFMLPSLQSDTVGTVVFASDWSGSTFGDLVKNFHAEKQGCLDEMRPRKLIDIGFDARVVKVSEYVPGDSIDPTVGGGGGTSFVPIWEHLGKLDKPAKCVVVLTDGDGEVGIDPGVPIIWCIYGNQKLTMPFGETINVE